MKVDFLGVGAQKAGTSALDAYLRAHPALCMAKVKEVHLFDDDAGFMRRTLSGYADYHAQFAPTAATALLGEVTPAYMYSTEAPRRIWEYNSAMKLIVVLRNPITRAFSHWNMQRARRDEPLPFWDALQSERDRCRSTLPHQHRKFSYVDRGYYTAQLRRLWSFFPTEQVLVLRHEALRDRPNPTLDGVLDFLGVARMPLVVPGAAHVLPYASPMSEREWQFLHDAFEFEIRALERLLHWDCSEWLVRPGEAANVD
ncbi:MAG: sulfotransferase domain-containing protein [Betaproteobacteria bacterium]